ncbi:zinc ribbon domain-containing protein [Neisseriaceae bacterium TC5R-5]|nr:zinc ribbon domain-containing protein [Neisseriaceae bacterium TC5R-5]
MPTYDYMCGHCGQFALLRAIAERDQPLPCPQCGAASQRQLLSAPQLVLPGHSSYAQARNEHACHQPACHHGSQTKAAKPSQSVTTKVKAYPAARPWMLSH